MTHQTIHALLTATTAKHSDDVALIAPARPPMRYAALLEHVERLGRRLNGLGIGRGDRVAIVLPNGPETAAAFLAVTAVAAAAPLNPGYRAPEFDFYLADLRAKALLVAAGSDSPAVAVAESRNVPVIPVSFVSDTEAGRFVLDVSAEDAGNITLAEPDDVALVLHTSGTTSRPKIVPLSQRNLCLSADNIRNTLQLSTDDRCLNVMPLFHIHGLVAAVLATLRASGSIACTPGFVATQVYDWLAELRPSWYTAVPTMHQAILARAEAHRDVIEASRLRFIRSSSSALPPQTARELERVFGVPVIEAYGMTEAAHQMCSNPLPPAERKFGSVGPAAGPDVAVMNESGDLLDADAVGEVVIRGGNVTAGYENNSQANDEAFTHGWFRTGDQGYLDDNGYLHLTGRVKEIINRGGEKISPREVDEVLLDHPAVVQAVTFAMPDARLGEEIAAAVVLRDHEQASEHALMAFAAERLAEFKVPRRVVVLDEIPKGPTGKPQRIGLAKKLGLDAADDAGQAAHVEPGNDTEAALAQICRDVLRTDRVGIHDNFFERGGDSILASQVIARVRQELGVEMPILVFFESPTVAGMASALQSIRAAPLDDDAEARRLLAEIEQMSDDEAGRLLERERSSGELDA